MEKIIKFIYINFMIFATRIGWYKYRKSLGYPISLKRAFFGSFPRFGSFEYNEVGCPKESKRDYEIVGETK